MTTAHGEGETGILRCFGQQLRPLRTSRGLTRAELGAKPSYGEDMVTSVELGRRIPKRSSPSGRMRFWRPAGCYR
ncbi:helix-turn-helix domain-containing protein [Streptomyces massasporeus]|uniref:helix-turn-helix domain-containing protein n=1 Tax=Streptomyces massasporeus TaxID=67324 RepID=UPI003406ADA5